MRDLIKLALVLILPTVVGLVLEVHMRRRRREALARERAALAMQNTMPEHPMCRCVVLADAQPPALAIPVVEPIYRCSKCGERSQLVSIEWLKMHESQTIAIFYRTSLDGDTKCGCRARLVPANEAAARIDDELTPLVRDLVVWSFAFTNRPPALIAA